MDIVTVLPIVSTVIATLSAVLAFYFNHKSAKKIQNLKSESSKEIQYLKTELARTVKAESLKSRYLIPLLKTAEELHNKLNDIVKNRDRVLPYFENLTKRLSNLNSIDKIIASPTNIYITHILYLLARYFSLNEVIKKEVGLVELSTNEDTKRFYRYLRSTVAVFFSNRLFGSLKIKTENHTKYQGKILEGAQSLMGESLLVRKENYYESMSYFEFCVKITNDEDFLKLFSPIIDIFEDIKSTSEITLELKNVDFRWSKIIFFASFIRAFIGQFDTKGIVALLPEIEQEEKIYLEKNPILIEKKEDFKKAYCN